MNVSTFWSNITDRETPPFLPPALMICRNTFQHDNIKVTMEVNDLTVLLRLGV